MHLLFHFALLFRVNSPLKTKKKGDRTCVCFFWVTCEKTLWLPQKLSRESNQTDRKEEQSSFVFPSSYIRVSKKKLFKSQKGRLGFEGDRERGMPAGIMIPARQMPPMVEKTVAGFGSSGLTLGQVSGSKVSETLLSFAFIHQTFCSNFMFICLYCSSPPSSLLFGS